MADEEFDVHFGQRLKFYAPFPRDIDDSLQVLREHMPKVLESYTGVKVIPFGSAATGLLFKESEMDVVVIVAEDIDDSKVIMQKIDAAFREEDGAMFCYCRTIHYINGIVPALNIKWLSFLKIRITVAGSNGDNHHGIRSSYLLMHYFGCDVRAKQLGMVIKMWALHHNLLGSAQRKLDSYTLSLLVIFYLQQDVNDQKPILPILQDSYPAMFTDDDSVLDGGDYIKIEDLPSLEGGADRTLSSLLWGFFNFYCSHFNFRKEVASVRFGKKLDRIECARKVLLNETGYELKDWYVELHVEDPFTQINVARNVDDCAAEHIKNVFKKSYGLLSASSFLEVIFF